MTEGQAKRTMYDVVVIGAGPAGAQAAVSAAHQMRHVLVLDAGPVSHRKGRAYWSKTVEIIDAPAFPGISGIKFMKALREWMAARPVRTVSISGRARPAGIELRAGMMLRLTRTAAEPGERAPAGHLFELEVSTAPLRDEKSPQIERFIGRTVVIASGFDDVWPDIEVEESARRQYRRYASVFRFAGNRKGWHVCIRCDGHLHVDEKLAILATGDLAWGIARGAQDFTEKLAILTNGRPHGFTAQQLATLRERGIPLVEEKIVAHVGKGTDLLGVRLESGRELFFDGFMLDLGLVPNTEYLRKEDGWSLQEDDEGLLVVDEDGQVLDTKGEPVPGLFAAGDIVAGQRNLIATAFALGQNAGLSASDVLREW
ncbi:MAG: NAD(P)/FAD-dependent oxidoreductase [Chloroflexi bacterium]|nr:NAD(P)/FAD-dependent oxidoreductase [Chloroflexota bacterium]